MRTLCFVLAIGVSLSAPSFCANSTSQLTVQCEKIAPQNYKISITLPIAAPEMIYRDYITLAVDHPHVTLTPWKVTPESIVMFDKHFKKDKQVFVRTITITCQMHIQCPLIFPIHLHIGYVTGPRVRTNHMRLALPIPPTS